MRHREGVWIIAAALLLAMSMTVGAAERQADRRWPAEWEEALKRRAQESIRVFAGKSSYGNTFFENEKRSYPMAMFDLLAGNEKKALNFLQSEDADAKRWHAHTNGIDFFPCFTLKGQVRKYFGFGDKLDPAYRQRMFDGAKAWTAQDPLGRPHPAYKGPSKQENWTPEARNTWVDARSTDNLTFMRDSAVYLFAEETGNEETRRLYADKLRSHLRSMYDVGMGEWDSENYLGHSFAPWLAVYDYAKDPSMREVARGALDWMATAAAVKYWRGGFNGPNKRDYYHPAAGRQPAANTFGIYFGETPMEHPEPDVIHLITSTYRPPQAVVALAQKDFDRPVELLMAHPPYDGYRSKPSEQVERPRHHEIQYIGRTFMLGTLPTGHLSDSHVADVNGFKMLAHNEQRGVDQFIVGTGPNAGGRITTATNGKDRLAQHRDTLLWLNADGRTEFQFLLPKSARVEVGERVIFISFEQTWMALWPINLKWNGVNDAATADLNKNYPLDMIHAAAGAGGAYCGFALEVGEGTSQEAFKQAVAARASMDPSALERGQVTYSSSEGTQVGIEYGSDSLPVVIRGQQRHDWAEHGDPYKPASGSPAPVQQAWKSGRLEVRAGGKTFIGSVDDSGNYTWSEK
jgi:hypothetical protein